MKLQKYTKPSISIILTLLLSYWLVSAWTNLSTVTNWQSLTATVWNDMVTKVNETGNRVSGIFTDGSGNVGIWNESPEQTLHVKATWTSAQILMERTWTSAWKMWIWADNYGLSIFNTPTYTRLLTVGSNWNVWIWTTSPTSKLHVKTSWVDAWSTVETDMRAWMEIKWWVNSYKSIRFTDPSALDGYRWDLNVIPANDVNNPNGIWFWNSTTWQIFTMRADNWNVWIWTITPWYKLTVNGQPAANWYTAFTNYSDRRLKENISSIKDWVLDKILKLNPVSFQYNDKYFDITWYDKSTKEKVYKWFIAQELKKVFPEMVNKKEIWWEEYLDTDLSSLQIYTLKAIQELEKEKNSQIAELKKQNEELLKRIEKLENKN